MKKKAVFNWSGGKDSALALFRILQGEEFEVISLLTTINEETATSSIHAIPIKLLFEQASKIGIPLYTVALSKDKKTYEEGMAEAVMNFINQGVSHFIFGDIFLEEVKSYRETKLNPLGVEVVEPLWGKSSEEVMSEFIASGIKTKIIVTQADKLADTFIGKDLDEELVNLFPEGVDICGENGEYHTFSYDGPIFQSRVEFEILTAKQISYEFKMDDGKTKSFTYWQAIFEND